MTNLDPALEKLLQAAYEQGWHESADWSERHDLSHYIESTAYLRTRDKRLAAINAQMSGKRIVEDVPVACEECCGMGTSGKVVCVYCNGHGNLYAAPSDASGGWK